ncbi:GFA family protein [uncultured Roseobacter sp.]|uniref:GFA family protein n=1 Tax=uncultured Roseobacter sp. TaxID=114847 RepID=UPI0026254063|nr:GFA family protein [uncultured Roseobacter sp.]
MTDVAARDALIAPHRRTGQMSGRCLCGAVKIEIDGNYVAAIGACHCVMCQRWNGMLFGSFVAETKAVAVTGPVRSYASSSFSERGFCETCGSSVWLRSTDPDEPEIELFPGLFKEAADFVLLSEIYTDLAPNYACLRGDHRRKTRAEVQAKYPFVEGDN